MIDLGYILRRAWEITKRYKSLWLFGFLVSLGTTGRRLGTGGGGRWEMVARELPPDIQRVVADFKTGPHFVIGATVLVVLGLVISVMLAFLNALGQAALVDQVRTAEDRGAVNLYDGWQAGRRHLWSVLLVRLLLGLPVAVLTLVGALPALGAVLITAAQERPELALPGILATELSLLACLIPTACLAVLLSIPLSVLQRLAVCACVLQERGVGQSIVQAWSMLREHTAPLVVIWAILLGLAIGVFIVVGLPLLLVLISSTVLAWLMALFSPLIFVGLILVIGLSTWLVGAAVSGVWETFSVAVWTLTYRELIGLGLTGEELHL